MPPTQFFVHTGKVALSVKKWESPLHHATVLILIHGYGSNSETWGRVVDKLSKAFELFTIDLRGMGRSGRYGKKSVRQTWADDVASAIAVLAKEPVVLVGHSLGGWVSAAIAAQYPDLISKAILVEPYTGAYSGVRKQSRQRPQSDRKTRAELIRSALTPKDLQQAVAKEYEGASDDSVRRIAKMWFEMDPDLEERPLSKSEETETFDDIFNSIECPTLIIQGSPDKGGILTDQETARVADLIGDSHVLKWPRVGHSPHIARDHDFVRAVKQFQKD